MLEISSQSDPKWAFGIIFGSPQIPVRIPKIIIFGADWLSARGCGLITCGLVSNAYGINMEQCTLHAHGPQQLPVQCQTALRPSFLNNRC